MHRRILAPVAAAALAFGLVACTDTGGSGTVTTPPPRINIGGGSDDGGAEPSDGGGDTSDGGGGGEASDGGGDSTVAAPDIPAPDPADYPGMDQNTPEGAEQAFRYYIAVVYWAHLSGDTEELSKLYRDSCESCTSLENEIGSLRASNSPWTSASIADVWVDHFDSPNFDVEISYGFTLASQDGDDTEPTEKKMTAVAGLDWQGEQWIVGGMQIGGSK